MSGERENDEREQVAKAMEYFADRAEHLQGDRLHAEDAPLFRKAAALIRASKTETKQSAHPYRDAGKDGEPGMCAVCGKEWKDHAILRATTETHTDKGEG